MSTTTRTHYMITFSGGRIGRRADAGSFTVTVPETDDRATDIAARVHAYAGRFLASRERYVEITMTDEVPGTGTGFVSTGMRSVASFTVAPDPTGSTAV